MALAFIPFLLFGLMISSFDTFADTTSKAVSSHITSMDMTAEKILAWLEELENRPRKVAIFNILPHPPIGESFASLFETELLQRLQQLDETKFLQCQECRLPQLEINDDKVIVTKGAPNLTKLHEYAKKYQVEMFLLIELFRSENTLVTQVRLVEAGNGNMVAMENFRTPLFSVQTPHIYWQVGSGKVLGNSNDESSGSSQFEVFSLGATIQEDLGFSYGGINAEFVKADSRYLLTLTPQLAWSHNYNRLGSLRGMFSMGAGFGLSKMVGGMAVRLTYDVLIGNLAGVGLSFTELLPLQQSVDLNPVRHYLGVFVKFSFGS